MVNILYTIIHLKHTMSIYQRGQHRASSYFYGQCVWTQYTMENDDTIWYGNQHTMCPEQSTDTIFSLALQVILFIRVCNNDDDDSMNVKRYILFLYVLWV